MFQKRRKTHQKQNIFNGRVPFAVTDWGTSLRLYSTFGKGKQSQSQWSNTILKFNIMNVNFKNKNTA